MESKIEDFLMDLSDREIEEVNQCIQTKTPHYGPEDIDLIVDARKFFQENQCLNLRMYHICNNWLRNDVEGLNPEVVSDAQVGKITPDVEIVGAVYMLRGYYMGTAGVCVDRIQTVWEWMGKYNRMRTLRVREELDDWMTEVENYRYDVYAVEPVLGALEHIMEDKLLNDTQKFNRMLKCMGDKEDGTK